MKKVIISSVLSMLVATAFAQHPLANKGPKAKQTSTLVASADSSQEIAIAANPSDKYAMGANAKNTTNVDYELTAVEQNKTRVFAKGANAKNKRLFRFFKKKADTTKQESEEEQLDNTIIQKK